MFSFFLYNQKWVLRLMKSYYHQNDIERYSREENLIAFHLAPCHRCSFQVDLNGFENRRVSIGYNVYTHICVCVYVYTHRH